MALIFADRVKETTTTTGTGSYTLDGSVIGHQTFFEGIGDANTCYYSITNGVDWEVGIGTVSAGALARTTIHASSNGDAAVNWSSGVKNIFCTVSAFAITAAGPASAVGTIVTGPSAPTGDGIWLECDGSVVAQSSYAALFAAIGHDFVMYDSTFVSTVTAYNAFGRFAYAGSNYLATDYDGGVGLYYSSDLVTWTASTGHVGAPTNDIVVDSVSGNVVISGADGLAYYSINDGVTFTASDLPNSGPLNLATGGGTTVAYTQGGSGFYYSTNGGVNWTVSSGGPVSGLTGVDYDAVNGVFIAYAGAGAGGGTIYKSADGITWSSVVVTSVGAPDIYNLLDQNVVCDDTGICIVKAEQGMALYVSDDGFTTWSIVTTHGFGYEHSAGIEYRLNFDSVNKLFVYHQPVNDVAVQVTTNRRFLTSTDGITWVDVELYLPRVEPKLMGPKAINGDVLYTVLTGAGAKEIHKLNPAYTRATQFFLPSKARVGGKAFIKAIA